MTIAGRQFPDVWLGLIAGTLLAQTSFVLMGTWIFGGMISSFAWMAATILILSALHCPSPNWKLPPLKDLALSWKIYAAVALIYVVDFRLKIW
jgi:hypothetical protein